MNRISPTRIDSPFRIFDGEPVEHFINVDTIHYISNDGEPYLYITARLNSVPGMYLMDLN